VIAVRFHVGALPAHVIEQGPELAQALFGQGST
jgi:hypothetical protein